MSEEVLLWWDGPLQPEEGVVLHAGLPQVFTGPVVHHVETQQRLPGLSLCAGRRRQQLVGHWITVWHSACRVTVGDQYSASLSKFNSNTSKDNKDRQCVN